MFLITCLERIERNDRRFLICGTRRTFGYFPTLEEAESALNNNLCDMHEYLYDYALIEEIHYGIHPDVQQEFWFQWDFEKRGFFRIEKPKETVGKHNFALG